MRPPNEQQPEPRPTTLAGRSRRARQFPSGTIARGPNRDRPGQAPTALRSGVHRQSCGQFYETATVEENPLRFRLTAATLTTGLFPSTALECAMPITPDAVVRSWFKE